MVKYEERCKDDNITIVFRIYPYFELILEQIQGGPNTTFMPFAVISIEILTENEKGIFTARWSMTDEKLKCRRNDPIFVGQNVQRVAKSFREACQSTPACTPFEKSCTT